MDNNLLEVGYYIDRFNIETEQNLPCGPIYQSEGLAIHVKKHHPETKDSIMLNIPNIISSPDYIGKNPKEPNSIELVKDIGKNTKVWVKLDTKNEYLYVASIFEIKEGKLNNRLNSGRLVLYQVRN